MPYKDYNASMNAYMKARWERRRALAVEKLGGMCARCGSLESLDFDHIDPQTKTMTIARASSRSESFFWEEVSKCQLLCKPCHIDKTAEDAKLALQG
ncbi:HNH endonuclease [Streptomyces phage Forrest]|nr:HNH endonuclease [Streptomyces phage Forrest]